MIRFFFAVLRGLQTRFRHQSVSTEDIVGYINEATGRNYTPFFDQYLRHKAPRLELKTKSAGDGVELSYKWRTDVDNFAMPIKITTAKDTWSTISPTNEWQTIRLPGMTPADIKVDTTDYLVAVDR